MVCSPLPMGPCPSCLGELTGIHTGMRTLAYQSECLPNRRLLSPDIGHDTHVKMMETCFYAMISEDVSNTSAAPTALFVRRPSYTMLREAARK